MKKIIFAAALMISSLSFRSAEAQLRINLDLNIGSQPDWGPVGYDHVEYYYMPDIDAYYYVPQHQYVYLQNNAWIRSTALPPRYANYDVYHSYKVVVNERNPWRHQDQIRAKYANYKGRRDQVVIRDSRDDKYRNHWNNGRGNGNGRGNNGRGNDHRDNHGDKGHGRGNDHH